MLRLQLEKVLLADAAYVHQLFHFLERTVLGSVLDDQRRRFRTDAGQRVELRGGCGVDVDRRGRRLGLDRCARGRLGLRRGGWRLNRDERREREDRQHDTKHLSPPLLNGVGPRPHA